MAVNFKKHEGTFVDEIAVTETLTAEMVNGFLDAGMDYCTYWCERVSVPKGGTIFVDGAVVDWATSGLYKSEWLALGGVLTFVVEGEKKSLARDAFADAVQAYCIQTKQTLTTLYDNHDASDGDSILQLALFGEVVYG